MTNWKETTLEEVVEFSNGRTSPERFDSGKYEVFGSNGIIGLSDETNSDANTIIIGRVGSYCGSLYFSKNKCWVTDNAIKANAKETSDPFYVYYLLITQKLNSKAAGSGQPLINQEILTSIDILLPPLPEQKAIAANLSSFDDKIELLRRENKTLENIAQTIFKEWFINFKVNGKKQKVNSSTGLPEGWRIGKLPDIFEVSPVGNLKKGELAPYLDMKGMPTQGHYAEGWYTREFTSGSKFANGDTLLARITPCLENGKTAFVDFLEEKQVGWGSTEFIVLRPKPPCPPFYGYLLARSNAFRNFAIGQMTGSSGRQRVPENCFESFNIAIPPDDILIRFSELIDPFVKHLKINAKQIQTLSKLRDTLLPKLMKGEIRVKDIETKVE